MFAGDVLFGWGLARVRAGTATTLSVSETVVAAVLAVMMVGERLPPLGWLGAVMVAASLFVLTLPAPRGRKLRRQRRVEKLLGEPDQVTGRV